MRYLQTLSSLLMPLCLSLAMVGGAAFGATDPEIPTEEERRHEVAECQVRDDHARPQQAQEWAEADIPLHRFGALLSEPYVPAGHRLANGLSAPLLR